MDSLLNARRPPVFCPGCAHERVTAALDRALQTRGLQGNQVAIVSDIGCSGLFDTFFNTHALHGLHGRALTYATGLKMARPDLTVVVTMGDGGLGIGGAHLLSACRRNLDLTLLILNNFNYGMTGGQCSSTTPPQARVASGFLNQLELPLDVCRVAAAAGAAFVQRASAYDKALSEAIDTAVGFEGFALVEIRGVCPGRYTKRNPLTPKKIAEDMALLPPAEGPVPGNQRPEYGRHYRQVAAEQKPPAPPLRIEARFKPPRTDRCEAVILGSAGQRIVTAGELLCLAGITAGLHATQKNDYPITVLRGHSVSEVVLSGDPIGFTGIQRPGVILALDQQGVDRKQALLKALPDETLVLAASDVRLPGSGGQVVEIDYKARGIRSADRALAALAAMAGRDQMISREMLTEAVKLRFRGEVLRRSLELVESIEESL
ncbi:MAG TPA: thiamine pyrophosphate-dependent enzyme [Desulfobacterales bacterium]